MWTIWQQLGGAGKGRRRGRDSPTPIGSTPLSSSTTRTPRPFASGSATPWITRNWGYNYKYEFTKLPWLDSKPKPVPATKRGLAARSTAPFVTSVFPVTLDKVVQVKVARPRKSRSKEEKEAEEEILLIEGIEVAMDEYAKFDVYLNDEDEPGAGKLKAEYAGSFASLPHKRKGSKKIRASLSLGLNEPLEDLGAEDDDAVLVTLAPKVGGGGRHC
nr:catechol oxidase [Ipomoea batatas]